MVRTEDEIYADMTLAELYEEREDALYALSFSDEGMPMHASLLAHLQQLTELIATR